MVDITAKDLWEREIDKYNEHLLKKTEQWESLDHPESSSNQP